MHLCRIRRHRRQEGEKLLSTRRLLSGEGTRFRKHLSRGGTCLPTKKMVDHAWRPVTDAKLLGFLGSAACKKRGWFPYENGHALVSHRAKALRSPEPIYKVKDYPYRVSMILRKGTWWIVERAQDLRQNNKTCFLEEEAEVLIPSCFLSRLPTRSRVCRNCLLSWLISFSSISLILCMEVPVRAVRQLE